MKPFNLKEYLKPHPHKVITSDGREVMIICTDSTMGDYHIDDVSIANNRVGGLSMKQFNLEEYLKNPSRKVVTRDGKNVTIHCTNLDGIFPIVAEIEGWGKSLSYNEYDENSYTESSICDLFFAPEKHEGWISIYQGKDGPITGNVVFASKEEAEESKKHCCGFTKDLYITSVKIEWEE